MSMSPIEIGLPGGRVLIGPLSLVPAARRRQFASSEGLRRLFAHPDAVARLGAQWKHIATPGDHAQYIGPADLRRALERAVAAHRLLILWLPAAKDVRVAPDVGREPGKTAAPTPRIPGQAKPDASRPATPVAVASLSRLERLERALTLSFRYVGPELRAKLARLDPVAIARDLAIVALAIAIAQLGGVTAAEIDAALLAIAYVLAGWTGLQGAWEFGAAAVAAVQARSDKEIDAAAHGFARAFTKLGEAVILWLIARISRPQANKAKASGQREATGQLEDREYVAEEKPPAPKPRNVVAERQAVARDFYRRTGWSEDKITDHLAGIDFTKPVEVVNLPKDTILSQYQYPGRPIGNYFAPPGTSPGTLGIDPTGRVETLYEVQRSTAALRSTAATVKDWLGSDTLFAGGGTQYFIPDHGNLIGLAGK